MSDICQPSIDCKKDSSILLWDMYTQRFQILDNWKFMFITEQQDENNSDIQLDLSYPATSYPDISIIRPWSYIV